MILKDSQHNPWIRRLLSALRHPVSLGVIVVLAYGAYFYRHSFRSGTSPSAAPALAVGTLSRIDLHIKKKHYRRLKEKRRGALARNLLVTQADDYVPATLKIDEKSVNVRLRLKGDVPDHYRDEKRWSFRVKVKSGGVFQQMRIFSLQRPETRGGIYEWFFRELLRAEGLVVPRNDFVHLYLNEQDLGPYTILEHFDTTMIEANAQRSGVIVKFDESAHWEERMQQWGWKRGEETDSTKNGSGDARASQVDVFDKKSVQSDPQLQQQAKVARQLLSEFRSGKKKATQVLDAEKFATYLAYAELFEGWHGLSWTNLRFYYNPVTRLLEPVVFDNNVMPSPDGLGTELALLGNRFGHVVGDKALGARSFHYPLERLLREPRFYRSYVNKLNQIAQSDLIEQQATTLEPSIERYRAFSTFSLDRISKNQAYLRTVLNPVTLARAFALQGSPRWVEIGNLQRMPVEIVSVECGEQRRRLSHPEVIPGRGAYEAPSYRQVDVGCDNPSTIEAQLLGMENAKPIVIQPAVATKGNPITPQGERFKGNVARFSFLVEKDNVVRGKQRRWSVTETLVIPKGKKLVLDPGTEIQLTNGASVISYSPLIARGTSQAPIVITNKGKGKGIAVLNAGGTSILEQVQFKTLAAPSENGWELTGAVTFYQSPVEITDTQFQSAKAEDSLNLIRSPFRMRRSTFSDAFSDALDADFSNGTIEHSEWLNCGNDCLDFSGSEVTLTDLQIRKAGDKALSAGEASRIKAARLDITGARIGVASKDRSWVQARELRITHSQYGLIAFQKKPEFGPAEIRAEQTSMKTIVHPVLVETGSTIHLNQKPVEEFQPGLRQRLYATPAG